MRHCCVCVVYDACDSFCSHAAGYCGAAKLTPPHPDGELDGDGVHLTGCCCDCDCDYDYDYDCGACDASYVRCFGCDCADDVVVALRRCCCCFLCVYFAHVAAVGVSCDYDCDCGFGCWTRSLKRAEYWNNFCDFDCDFDFVD